MNFFQRLFGTKAKQPASVETPLSQPLFVDNQPPADALIAAALHPQAPESDTLVADKKQAKGFTFTRPAGIREFLDRDYYALGHEDAMLNPTAETRDSKLAALGARFRFVATHALEHLDAQVMAMKQQMILMDGVSAVVRH